MDFYIYLYNLDLFIMIKEWKTYIFFVGCFYLLKSVSCPDSGNPLLFFFSTLLSSQSFFLGFTNIQSTFYFGCQFPSLLSKSKCTFCTCKTELFYNHPLSTLGPFLGQSFFSFKNFLKNFKKLPFYPLHLLFYLFLSRKLLCRYDTTKSW